jgi:hypothetical protein
MHADMSSRSIFDLLRFCFDICPTRATAVYLTLALGLSYSQLWSSCLKMMEVSSCLRTRQPVRLSMQNVMVVLLSVSQPQHRDQRQRRQLPASSHHVVLRLLLFLEYQLKTSAALFVCGTSTRRIAFVSKHNVLVLPFLLLLLSSCCHRCCCCCCCCCCCSCCS